MSQIATLWRFSFFSSGSDPGGDQILLIIYYPDTKPRRRPETPRTIRCCSCTNRTWRSRYAEEISCCTSLYGAELKWVHPLRGRNPIRASSFSPSPPSPLLNLSPVPLPFYTSSRVDCQYIPLLVFFGQFVVSCDVLYVYDSYMYCILVYNIIETVDKLQNCNMSSSTYDCITFRRQSTTQSYIIIISTHTILYIYM